MQDQEYHIPIMLDECIEGLDLKDDGIYLDGTLGGGGHSFAILSRNNHCKLISIDRDMEAIKYASNRLKTIDNIAERSTIVNDNFKNACEVLDSLGIDKIDGVLLDLGISSHQIDDETRGFSYRFDAKLDMRMDSNQELSAYEVVNEYSEEDLANIIYQYGEERFSRRIAKRIVELRKIKPVSTTNELVEIVKKCVPFNPKSGHPAKRTFQALRIEVNGELDGLSEIVHKLVDRLKSGGRICIMSFHSLEDRIVKTALRELSTDCICDKSLPICICNHKATIKNIASKVKASAEEVDTNSRSSSATLRIAKKL